MKKDSIYWVDDWFLAGEYPATACYLTARMKLGRILKRGINTFIDLTEPGEYGLRPYCHLLPKGVRHLRFPIVDCSTPTDGKISQVLTAIAVEEARGNKIYVHCYGGHGRTGLIVGCWLAENGYPGIEALDRLRVLRWKMPGNDISPQTRQQQTKVLDWKGA